MATPPEEIERQHAHASTLLKTLPPFVPPSSGPIPLKYKTAPLATLYPAPTGDDTADENMPPPPPPTDVPCLSTMAEMDISKIKDLISHGHNSDQTSLWSPDYAAKHNVSITRPSHDAWGIKKIMLIFCDDFLQSVYTLPFYDKPLPPPYTGKSFKRVLEPIISALGIKPSKIVRMLFASLPPGVTIPVHHDTGEWVNKSHRIHVPIITNPSVLFLCGGSHPSHMKRVSATEGLVFEMNNQSKHAVSNCSSFHRVHLILDYVDSHVPKRVVPLSPGETILQTRRSIDVKSDYGKTPCPKYLIIGAQKAGTTSMYEYICSHPWGVKGRRRETHFFDWRWQASLTSPASLRSFYMKFFYYEDLKSHPSCITGDSTPSYLLHSDLVIPRVKTVCPWTKIIVMLRNPVDRALSHYRMVTSEDGTEAQKQVRGRNWVGKTFEDVIEEELRELEEVGLYKGGEWDYSKYGDYLKTRPMGTGSHSLLVRGCYWMQLQAWLENFKREDILIERMEDMKRDGIQKTVSRAYEFLGLPEFKVVDEGSKNSRSYDGMEEATRERLEQIFEAEDRKLFEGLGWEMVEGKAIW
ncbi:hypothetical protein TrVE_jg13254 [Triparma verrucosa]|uniref:Sulfotransferase n=1 Tax=Triparma verrucosa TaxID=1606542 RepID=A0A9W7BD00_9STRA|nr:hypothetical protein TrVE_jg13254 [Triparma verrucosa]